MNIGVKSLEKRESEFTRKLVFFGIVALCILIGIGFSLILTNQPAGSSSGALIKVLSFLILPFVFSFYILIKYYTKLSCKK
ncbi:hypothetical protein KO495_07345 [Colwellia sp. D2M02]|uniref:Uncharacterized protein n=1 Tax=Colwellia asteriadis TaxID=517723 RepID=A0ABN1L2N7_9GAMM|nr:hypothetical protein [Colwellia sp. D2M02]MBU2893141.1 hypothetical protein [Colwellia sp. D2M02]